MLGLGCVERTSQQSTAARVFMNIPDAKKSVGKPRKRRLNDVENDLQKTCVRRWRKMARDSDGWNRILKEIRVLHGL